MYIRLLYPYPNSAAPFNPITFQDFFILIQAEHYILNNTQPRVCGSQIPLLYGTVHKLRKAIFGLFEPPSLSDNLFTRGYLLY